MKPLRDDPERLLAYDDKNFCFVLKLDSSQMNTVRAALRGRAQEQEALKALELIDDNPAMVLSVQIEEEVQLFIKESLT